MNTILGAIAGGRNILVLLAFAAIGYFLVITPPLDTFSEGALGRYAVAFGWNFLAAWLITWLFRLFYKSPDKYKFAFAYLVAGLAAIAGVLMH